MEYGEIDSSLDMFLNSNMEMPSSCSMDSFFDEILKDTPVCTHTHTCNLPGPDKNSHTHTCLHIHTKLIPGESESEEKNTKTRNVGGNREAVRKYRQKKKAMAASLGDEVARLKAENQELARRLRNQAVLEAEIVRLKCLLVDIRGRLDGEIGSFPYQKAVRSGGDMYLNMGSTQNMANAYVMNPCNFHCLNPGVRQERSGEIATMVDFHGVGGCDFQDSRCLGNQNAVSEVKNGTFSAIPPVANKKKGKIVLRQLVEPLV